MVARDGGWGWGGEMSEEGEMSEKLQISSDKINKSWAWNVKHGDYS